MKDAKIFLVTVFFLLAILALFAFSGGLIYAIFDSIGFTASNGGKIATSAVGLVLGIVVIAKTHMIFNREYHKIWDRTYGSSE